MEHDFVVSALKYRPNSFDTVVGQSTITSTLKSAIRNGQIGKAFLFCGPRGVGKTTCARILAKVINCSNPTENVEACGECESCKSFQEGHSLNVHELDAASNNKVEHIRELIEQVRLAPQVGSYKAYIIDEVHMLSQQAFNAFLKTLEEPPDHAIFILATTEKHKVLPTILSRCQIYDFHRIGIQDIAEHLGKIAEKEGVEAEYDALHSIASKADGALRDALTIFDQLVASSGKQLSYQHVVDSLNILDHEHYFQLSDHLLQGDVPQAVLSFNDVLQRGFDGQHFLNGLARHFRDLLMARDERTLPLLEMSDELRQRFAQQAKACDPELLIEGLNKISESDSAYRNSKDQRLLVELTLLQLCRTMNPDELKKKPQPGRDEELKDPEKSEKTPEEEQGNDKDELESGASEDFEKEAAETSLETDQKEEIQVEEEEESSPPANTPEDQGAEEPPPTEEESFDTGHEVPGAPEEVQSEPEPEERTAAEEDNVQEQDASPEPVDKKDEAASTATTRRKRIKGTGKSLRISEFRNGGETEVESEVAETSPDERKRASFSYEDLKKAWQGFLDKKKENPGLLSALRNITPALEEEEKLVMKASTTMEKERLWELSTELLGHLKKSLGNEHIELDVKLEKSEEEGEQKAYYTAKQQFDRMVEKNPHIKELRDRFDLDLER